MTHYNVIIIGGGAAGFFTAINTAENFPDLSVAILERTSNVLSKVKISGGGRCNVTHAEFIPKDLTRNYPRGEKELLGPFHTFMTGDTLAWFEERGVPIKMEEDGRMFPVSNSSQTIIDCFTNETDRLGVEVLTNQVVVDFNPQDEQWLVKTKTAEFICDKLVVATGSSAKTWSKLKDLDLAVVNPVPSLFTFNCKDQRLQDIPGVVVKNVSVKVKGESLESSGPILVTHWGLSAPSILKLSAFGAIALAERDYKFDIVVNFIQQSLEETLQDLKGLKQELNKKTVLKFAQFDVPKRLWYKLVEASDINDQTRWADLNKQQLEALAKQLTEAVFSINGKSTFKDEFVTAGGLDLKELNFKTYQSKKYKHLFFAGEVINVDAVTGGFNFQNAWTSGYIVAQHIGL